jgi:hypothetical protein
MRPYLLHNPQFARHHFDSENLPYKLTPSPTEQAEAVSTTS